MSTALAPMAFTPVYRINTAAPTRCEQMGVCLSLRPSCQNCELVRGGTPALSPDELRYLKRDHALTASD